jgi:hypothetical protein
MVKRTATSKAVRRAKTEKKLFLQQSRHYNLHTVHHLRLLAKDWAAEQFEWKGRGEPIHRKIAEKSQ